VLDYLHYQVLQVTRRDPRDSTGFTEISRTVASKLLPRLMGKASCAGEFEIKRNLEIFQLA
jgi:hypothetical protein